MKVLALVTCAFTVAVLALLLHQQNQPRWKGRTLQEWLAFRNITETGIEFPHRAEADRAITCIATNSLDVLLYRLAYDPTHRLTLINKVPAPLLRKEIVQSLFFPDPNEQLVIQAMSVFEIAGTNATSAIPALSAMALDTTHEKGAQNALYALASIGPGALPAIRQATQSQSHWVRGSAMGALSRLGTNAAPAIPDVLRALSDPAPFVRLLATNTLIQIAPQLAGSMGR